MVIQAMGKTVRIWFPWFSIGIGIDRPVLFSERCGLRKMLRIGRVGIDITRRKS